MSLRAAISAGLALRARALLAVLVAFGLALLAPASAWADSFRLLNDNRLAAQARVDLIQSAEHEINVCYFSVADDRLARAMLALLRDAALRGVRVRVLVDAVVNHMPPTIERRLLAAGVEIREYHPIRPAHLLWINRRMHDKLLVVDHCHLIVGSRNLDARNFGLACRNFVDSDAYLCGCAAGEADAHFNSVWNSDEVRPVDPDRCALSPLDDGPTCPDCALNGALAELVNEGFIYTAFAGDWGDDLPVASDVRLLFDPGGKKRQPGGISEQVLELFANAQESIILESPYLVFSHDLENAIAKARARGVEVVVFTNSLASTDHTVVYAGYANQKRRMLARGVEFWEYRGPEHFHAKTAVVDGCSALIGSYNFDPRSERLNTETAILSSDLCIVDAVLNSMSEHFACAWQIGPDGTPLETSGRHPGVSLPRLMKYRAERVVAPLLKRHL